MIDEKTVRHRSLRELLVKGRTGHIRSDLVERVRRRLAALEAVEHLGELRSLQSLGLHALRGRRRRTWAIRVNAQWRMTFRFSDQRVFDLDLEQYH